MHQANQSDHLHPSPAAGNLPRSVSTEPTGEPQRTSGPVAATQMQPLVDQIRVASPHSDPGDQREQWLLDEIAVELRDCFAQVQDGFGRLLADLLCTESEVRFADLEPLHEFPRSDGLSGTDGAPRKDWEPEHRIQPDPLLALALVESMLGSETIDGMAAERPLSEIEAGLLGRLKTQFDSLWQQAVPAREWEMDAGESEPESRRSPDPAVGARFDIRVGGVRGRWRVLVRRSDLLRRLGNRPVGDARSKAATLTAFFSAGTRSAKQLRELRPGDLLSLSARAEEPVLIEIDGRVCGSGKLGQRGKRRALEVKTLY